jgi:hypothetical protein
MSIITIACLVFVCCFGAALVGMVLHAKVPKYHLDGDSRDTVKLVIGLMATMAALVLGLLISSASSSYNTQETELQQTSANLVQLDRMLVLYGPETREIRDILRQSVTVADQRIWSPEDSQPLTLDPGVDRALDDAFLTKLQNLTPTTDDQSRAQSAAWQLGRNLIRIRMLMYQQLGASLSWPLLVVLVFWTSMLFLGFGLLARAHVTNVIWLLVGAISVVGAIFLILELHQPYGGLLRLSDAPIRTALASMNR